MSGRRDEELIGFIELPIEVVDVEEQDLARVFFRELIEDAPLPAFGEVVSGFQVFVEEAVFVGDAEEIEHVDDHAEVGEQEDLRKIGGEILFAGLNAGPEFGFGFAQRFGIELNEVGAQLEALIDLIGLQFTDRNAADEVAEDVGTESEVDVTHPHWAKLSTGTRRN
jgi:hypothetical protein